jgi:hypothetical protein
MRATLLLLVWTVVLVGCADPTSPTVPFEPQMTKDCTFFNCGEDPSPEAGGLYLGAGVTPTFCDAAASDTDQDGVDNVCESTLAEAFRPLMISGAIDDVRGESYWAVQRFNENHLCGIDGYTCLTGNFYRIVYLLGYYWDWGTGGFAGTFGGGGHIGDSEWVAIDVQYSSGRWYMMRAEASAHFGTAVDKTHWSWTEAFAYGEWGDEWATYPRIWVAQGKHAGYASISECNSHPGENCSHADPVYWRVEFVPGRNIGSRAHPARSDVDLPPGTCKYSQETFAGNGRAECFWAGSSAGYYRFAGWQESSYDVNTYSAQLSSLWF